MKLSQLVGKRIKETPKDAQTMSHVFLIRGGYVRPVSAGIYSLLPLAKRITQKIEAIIRQEMNRIDGQEVLMPVVLPRELWEESGRYRNVGPELLRFKDRNGKDMLLGMTHEEAVVHLARSEVNSYKQMPFMLYQIQTKYRDEARPRAGLIRVREFTMKDAYSFHTSDECLKSYYARAHEAYERIFKRIGLKDVVSIESDTGMMGGAVSHEFMAISDCGEDTLFICPKCGYRANKEVARSALKFEGGEPRSTEKVHTPNQKTIDEVARFLGVQAAQTGKAVFYTDDEGRLYFVVIRGDLEVNETKLKNHLKLRELKFANDEQIRAIGAEPGFASPLNLDPGKCRILFDQSVAQTANLVVGANEPDYHLRNFCFDRDMKAVRDRVEVLDIAAVRDGDPCPSCKEALSAKRGIEVGNIFQLGTKYSKDMNCTYLDKNGKSQFMIMGCYGIGVGRSLASVIEQSHDQYGPVWPISIAPYQVHICALNVDQEPVRLAAEKLYADLSGQGIEVLYDDRNEKAGSAFNDADLIGVPVRVIVSPKTIGAGEIELKTRDKSVQERVPVSQAQQRIEGLVKSLLAAQRF